MIYHGVKRRQASAPIEGNAFGFLVQCYSGIHAMEK